MRAAAPILFFALFCFSSALAQDAFDPADYEACKARRFAEAKSQGMRVYAEMFDSVCSVEASQIYQNKTAATDAGGQTGGKKREAPVMTYASMDECLEVEGQKAAAAGKNTSAKRLKRLCRRMMGQN